MLKNIAPKSPAITVLRSRRLRREMTLPEVILWQALRRRPKGLKFRRQHPTGLFILDFFCSDARLAIEIDGEAHDRGTRPADDQARDAFLAQASIETLRVPAAEVFRDAESVIRGIIARAMERLPLHHPARPGGPPPRGELGED